MPYAWQVVPEGATYHFVLDSRPHVQGYIEVADWIFVVVWVGWIDKGKVSSV